MQMQNQFTAPAYYGGATSPGRIMPMAPETFDEGDEVIFNGDECVVVYPRGEKLGQRYVGRMLIETPRGVARHETKVPPDWESRRYDRYYWVNQNEVTKTGKKVAKKVKVFDLKKLDPLVVADEVLEEIRAVLKQKQNSKKMFEEWGLGEVIEYGKGMTFLFYGPPGTGKTWAATCIAKVFGTDLLTIGAAEIQTSEPGGANRNIKSAFEEAKKKEKILFIDECDSLITSRGDVGMILGGEINTLLTEIEKAEGVVILATNRIENLDEALERRISLIVEFPEPDYEQRKKIWEKLIPKKLPLAKVITPDKLAEYKLTGGQIKNVLLQAARLALSSESPSIEVPHIEAAVERIIRSKSLMGSASRYHQIKVRDDLIKS